ncbi:MAG: sugar phosphate isomerase [Lentisphaeria bacterium]|nr:sugar phosphate isomerase [Lentisphaeria bacterium]
MSERSDAEAIRFINEETQFHLGFLPTEQSSPLSRNLDRDFAESAEKGVRTLQSVDRNVPVMLRRVLAGPEFRKLTDALIDTIGNGGKVVFSGCGATGRLSILLEGMWRDAVERGIIPSKYKESVYSIMTGGDFALIRSVEFFEDYAGFGARQAADLGMGKNDTLVAITEGGETSSVLGTVFEALERNCRVFLLFNNPAELLAKHIERSRRAIEDPRVCVLDLNCGPMALAGSTRMQATTSEQFVAGAALETAACHFIGRKAPDYLTQFEKLLDELESKKTVGAIADYIRFESEIYRKNGKITYFADRFLLDIFTDTTERSPTFMLPPFRAFDDTVSPRPWAFVKNPVCSTGQTWMRAMNRPLRCLDWTSADLAAMGAPESVASRPPKISAADMLKIQVGNENPEERCSGPDDAAVLVTVCGVPSGLRQAYEACTSGFKIKRELDIAACGVASAKTDSPLELIAHMAVKLFLNTVSTGTMAVLGRVTGNWMSWVDCTNKKLIDRAARLISEIGGLDYRESCLRLFEAREILQRQNAGKEKCSPVQYVLKNLRSSRK